MTKFKDQFPEFLDLTNFLRENQCSTSFGSTDIFHPLTIYYWTAHHTWKAPM